VETYQNKFDDREKRIYTDHLMKCVVKTKCLEPPIDNFELLNTVTDHSSINVQKARVTTRPETLQEAASLLSDIELFEKNNAIR
jgi:hypothetical protein